MICEKHRRYKGFMNPQYVIPNVNIAMSNAMQQVVDDIISDINSCGVSALHVPNDAGNVYKECIGNLMEDFKEKGFLVSGDIHTRYLISLP